MGIPAKIEIRLKTGLLHFRAKLPLGLFLVQSLYKPDLKKKVGLRRVGQPLDFYW